MTAMFKLTPCFLDTFSKALAHAKGLIPPALLITFIPIKICKKSKFLYSGLIIFNSFFLKLKHGFLKILREQNLKIKRFHVSGFYHKKSSLKNFLCFQWHKFNVCNPLRSCGTRLLCLKAFCFLKSYNL